MSLTFLLHSFFGGFFVSFLALLVNRKTAGQQRGDNAKRQIETHKHTFESTHCKEGVQEFLRMQGLVFGFFFVCVGFVRVIDGVCL